MLAATLSLTRRASPTTNDVRGDNKGKRLIIAHAMTRHGMLTMPGVEPSNILTEMYESAALVFDEVCVDNISPADYHDTYNGPKFIGWMRTRLLPTFAALHPGKKMILILDNASYHHHRGADWITPSKMNKGQLADYLRQAKVPFIDIGNGDKIMANKFSADRTRRAGGPTLEQLRTAVQAYLDEHNINTTVPEQLMRDAGHTLLYTPPYVSELQPIELIWAYVKRLVAMQSHRTRTPTAAAAQTRIALDKVTAALCASVIDHAHAWMVKFMHGDHGGTLKQYTDLASIVLHAAAHDIIDAESPDV